MPIDPTRIGRRGYRFDPTRVRRKRPYSDEEAGYLRDHMCPYCKTSTLEGKGAGRGRKRCTECGSIDVCQEWLNRHEYGWVCDHCDHEWDIEVPDQDRTEQESGR